MAKKIFDILLPKPSPSFQKEKPLIFRKKADTLPSLRKKSRDKRKAILGLISLILIITGIFVYFGLPRAEIEIWPETEIKTFDIKVTADKKIENTDFSANLIPGILFEESRIFSREFPSSGKKLIEKKAEGIIRVFNEYHTNQVLVAGTRFQAPLERFNPSLERPREEPWFLTTERIVVPAKGYKDVRVVAHSPGEKYNIEPSYFSIPGLAGTPQYTFIYGQPLEAMKGGFKKEVSEVTQEDLKKAEEILIEEATKETKDFLKNKIPTGFVVLEEALKTNTLEAFSLIQAGAELEKFIFQVKIEAQTISFKKEDLENFSKEFVAAKIPADKKVDQKSFKIEYSPETVDLNEGKIILSLNLRAKLYSIIDEISLKKGLVGESLTETQYFLQNQPEIIRSQVKLWPFWVKQVPENLEKIKIKITVDPLF